MFFHCRFISLLASKDGKLYLLSSVVLWAGYNRMIDFWWIFPDVWFIV
jgi:hypothetical protein